MDRKMRHFKTIGLSIILFLSISCSSGQNKSETRNESKNEISKYKIPEFDIEFPKTEFKVAKTENRDPSLNVLITNMILQGADNNNTFMYFVAYNELPEKLKTLIEKDSNLLNVAFQAMLTSSATKLGGTDFKFKEITLNELKGTESICKVFDGNGIIKSRIFLIENYIFMISAGGRDISIEKVDNFLNSFRIKK
jgi:hypothetical protein